MQIDLDFKMCFSAMTSFGIRNLNKNLDAYEHTAV